MNRQPHRARHIALQFGRIKHFNEGLSEVSRQLGLALSSRAVELERSHGIQFHFILEEQWHGMFGDAVRYHALTDHMRLRHVFPVDLDIWHGLHQHMRYRPPVNSHRNIVTVHDLNFIYAKAGLSRWWQNVRLSKHLRQADQLVAISKFVADDISRQLPWAPQATVIHNGVADLTGASQAPIDWLRDTAYLLHISRMSPSKNVGALIEMARLWPEKKLVLAGPASDELSMHKQHAANLALSNVCFLTDISEEQKAWLYSNAQAFLFPSLFEGFGLPPVEAMYFGKPVVIAPNTSLPEICGSAAAYWIDFAPLAMRKTVEEHLARHQGSPQYALTTREQALKYSWPIAATKYLGLYDIGAEKC